MQRDWIHFLLSLMVCVLGASSQAEHTGRSGDGLTKGTVIAGEPIVYIQNIVHFLNDDNGLSLRAVGEQIRKSIALQRDSAVGQEENTDLEHIGRDGCMLCHKQFKSSQYLALHYATRHQGDLQGFYGGKPSYNTGGDGKILLRVLREPIFEVLTATWLQILTDRQLPAYEKFHYCQQLGQAIESHYQTLPAQDDPYKLVFDSRQKIREFCLILAWGMWAPNQWAEAGRYVALIVLIFVAVGLCMCCLQGNKQSGRPSRSYKGE